MEKVEDIKTNAVNSSETLINLYRTVPLYDCETWSLKLREERRLRMFQERVLKKTIGFLLFIEHAPLQSVILHAYIHC